MPGTHMYCTIGWYKIWILGLSVSRKVFHFCMCNFVSGKKGDWVLFPETNTSTKVWRFRKYTEPTSRIGGNSGFKYRHKFRSYLGTMVITLKFKKTYDGISVFSNRIFSGSRWPLIIFNIIFSISECDAGDPQRSTTLKSDKIYG
jgi:hypothetical protein